MLTCGRVSNGPMAYAPASSGLHGALHIPTRRHVALCARYWGLFSRYSAQGVGAPLPRPAWPKGGSPHTPCSIHASTCLSSKCAVFPWAPPAATILRAVDPTCGLAGRPQEPHADSASTCACLRNDLGNRDARQLAPVASGDAVDAHALRGSADHHAPLLPTSRRARPGPSPRVRGVTPRNGSSIRRSRRTSGLTALSAAPCVLLHWVSALG